MDENLQAGAAAQLAPPKPPKVRMDRGREFSTVHGERGPQDPHKAVHFYQDGLPFDAHGHLIFDHPDLNDNTEESAKLRRVAGKKVQRQLALDAKQSARRERSADADDADDGEAVEADDDGDDENEPEEVNLSMWLRGEQNVPWNEVSQHIARRHKKRMNSIEDAVVFLVKEGVAPENAVAKKFKKFLD